MAGNIKGITIEFDSDTTKLKKGIKSIQSESQSLQRQINKLNKDMKFDGGNTELIAQRMDAMARAAAAAITEVETLKQVQANLDASGVDKASDGYRNLELEIARAEAKTKQLEQSYQDAMDGAPIEALQRQYVLLQEDIAQNEKQIEALIAEQKKLVSEDGTISDQKRYDELQRKIDATRQKNVLLREDLQKVGQSIDTKQATEGVEDLGDAMEETGEAAEESAEGVKSAQEAMNDMYQVLAAAGLINLVRALAKGFEECIDTSAELGKTMSKVSALSGATGDQLAALESKAKELGARTAFTSAEAAEGFSYMALAGWDVNSMLEGITPTLSLAAAAEMDLGQASDIVTDYLTAFGLSASDTGMFVDQMAYAMANSNTNVAQLGEAYKSVAATASSLGYTVEETTSAIMVMSNAGLKGSEAGTALNAIMTRLATNTKDCADILSEYGVKVYDQQGNIRSLSDILGDMAGIWYDLSDAEQANLAKVVAGQSHYSALQTVMAGAAKTAEGGISSFEAYRDALSDCSGAAEDMANTMMDNLTGDMTRLQSATDGLKVTIGQGLEPAMRSLTQVGTDAVTWLNDFIKEHEGAIPIIAGAAAAVSTMTVSMTALVAVQKVWAALKASETFMSMLTPIGLASAAVGALVAGFALAASEAETSISSTAQALEDLKKASDEQASAFQQNKSTIAETIENNTALYDRLISLTSAYDGSASAAAEIKVIIDKLNQSVPELNLSFDEQTGSLNMTADAVENLIKKQSAYDTLIAAIENRDALKTQFDNASAAAASASKAYEDAAAALEDWKIAENGQVRSNSQYEASVEYLRVEMENAKAAASSASDAYIGAQREVNSAKEAFDGLSDASASASDSVEDASAAADSASGPMSELSDEAQKAHDAIKEVGEAAINASGSGDELREQYDDLKKTFDANADACDAQLRAFVELKLEELNLKATTAELAESLPLVGAGYEQIAAALVATGTSAQDFAKWYTDAFSQVADGFDTLEINTENTLNKWIDTMTANQRIQDAWNSNTATLVEAVNNASTYPYTANNEALRAAIKIMMDGGVEQYGQSAQELATAIQSGDTATVDAIVNSINSAGAAAMDAAAVQFAMANNLTQSEMWALMDSGKVALEDGAYVWSDAAAANAAGVASGISSEEDTATEAANSLVSAAAGAILDSETRTAWETGGKALGQYLINGIKEKTESITSAAKSALMSAAAQARSTAQAQGRSVGYWFDLGLASGISSNAYLVRNAAYNVASEAAEAARNAIRVSSPSKDGIEIGAYFSEGMAIGIGDGQKAVERAAEVMARAAAVSAGSSVQTAVTNNTYGGNTFEISINAGAGQSPREIAREVMNVINNEMVRNRR